MYFLKVQKYHCGANDISPYFEKMITNGWILEFKVSKWLYWSVNFYAGIKILLKVICLLKVLIYHSGANNISPYLIKWSPMDGF